LLPQGIHTPDNFLYTLHDATKGSKVGLLWYACREQAGVKATLIKSTAVEPYALVRA
jgi:hypothetical protein